MWCRTSTFGGRGNCLDCCINNICQLACVCPLPWEFSQPEESRDCALAEGGREKLFQKKDNNVQHFTCKDYSVDSRRAKYGILHPYNLHHGGVVLCASICPPSPVWSDGIYIFSTIGNLDFIVTKFSQLLCSHGNSPDQARAETLN